MSNRHIWCPDNELIASVQLLKIQILFKGKTHDIAISGDTVEQIVAEYKEVAKKLGYLMLKEKTVRQVKKRTAEAKRPSIYQRVLALKTEGFFKAKRTLEQVQKELARKGTTKPVTTISPRLTALVQDGELKRDQKKTNGRIVYFYYVG